VVFDKKLYEQALLALSEKEEIISVQRLELDKLRKFIFGFKSEKRTNEAGYGQIGLFYLGVAQSVQREFSESVSTTNPIELPA
jgi:hypothetical protein